MKVKSIAQRTMMGAGVTAIVLGLTVQSFSAQAQDHSASSASQAKGADSDAAAKVKSALNSNPTFDGRHVDVAMDKGNVVLSGFVQSSHALQEATRIATKAAGDHKVVNHLSINQNYPNAP
jgi:osmotically-inducible protein OsmY